MQFDRSPAEVWRKYERDRDYKRSIGLYDRVRRNEAFYLGRQWEGLRVQSLDPLIFNVLRRCVNLFVAMLVSDDVAVRVTPFEMNGEGRRTAHVLGQRLGGGLVGTCARARLRLRHRALGRQGARPAAAQERLRGRRRLLLRSF